MTALAEIVNNEALPDLAQAQATIQRLIDEGAAQTLDEARRQAEAYALYEKRAGHGEREAHFGRLRLLTEAAIGVLSFDDPSVIEKKGHLGQWRALAAAFERGKLLAICDSLAEKGSTLLTSTVADAIRWGGGADVPGKVIGLEGESVPWRRARELARKAGIPLTDLPMDLAATRVRREAAAEQSRRMTRLYLAQERLDRMKLRKEMTHQAELRGPKTARAYGLLRRALQALHESQGELGRPERRELERALSCFYMAEDHIAAVLGLRAREEDYR